MKIPISLAFGALFVLLLASGVLACKPSYGLNESVLIADMIQPNGLGAVCSILIANETGDVVRNDTMTRNGLSYTYDAGTLPKNLYTSLINCTAGTDSYYGSCAFTVESGEKMSLATIILLPLFISVFFFVAAFLFKNDKEHKVYSWGLHLFAFIFSIASFLIAMLVLVKYYADDELAEQLGLLMWVYGFIFLTMMAYWFMYYIKKWLDYARNKRDGGED